MFTSTKHAVDGFPMIPDSHWLLGHLPIMSRSTDFREVQYKYSYEHADENGRVCFWMGPATPSLSVSSVRDVQHVLRCTSHRTLFPLMMKHNDEFLGKRNIGVLTGKEWKSNRIAILKALHHSPSIKTTYYKGMIQSTQVLVESLMDGLLSLNGDSDQQRLLYPIDDIMKMLTMDIFGQAAMNEDFGCCRYLELSPIATAFEFLTSDMTYRLKHMMDLSNYLYSLPTSRNLRHKKEINFLRTYVNNVVNDRRNQMLNGETINNSGSEDVPRDLVTNLIKVQQRSSEGNAETDLSVETLVDTLLSLLFAGYETTSVTLTYALYLISQYAEVEAYCIEEIDNAWKHDRKNSDEATTLPVLNDLVYLDAVLMETLRLYPPAISTTRSLDKPISLDGTTVKEGIYMYIPIWHIQRDEKHFPNPEAFLPERWVKKKENGGGWKERSVRDDDDDNDLPPIGNIDAFVAFSAGARSCPGQKFAKQELTLALSVLLRSFKFTPQEGYVLTPVRDGFVQKPNDGMLMYISKR